MTRRDLVKAAIAHKTGDRLPYCFEICPDAHEALRNAGVMNGQDLETFIDNDVQDIGVPWWGWYGLGADWSGYDAPASPATVMGYGSYEDLPDRVRALRDRS